jgi:Rab-GTPase-TBC domain
MKKDAIAEHVLCFDHYFKRHLPLLYKHMKMENLTSEMYLASWNLALFAKVRHADYIRFYWLFRCSFAHGILSRMLDIGSRYLLRLWLAYGTAICSREKCSSLGQPWASSGCARQCKSSARFR